MLILRITEEHVKRYQCKLCEDLLTRKAMYGGEGKAYVELQVNFLDYHWEYNSVPVACDVPLHTCPFNLKWILKELLAHHLGLENS